VMVVMVVFVFMLVLVIVIVIVAVAVAVAMAFTAVRFMSIMMSAKLNVAARARVIAQCIIGEKIVMAGGISRGHCFCAVAVTFTIMRVALRTKV
jgi:hypothetical protein